MIAGEGDRLPVSAFPVDGTFPTGTACWEKRNIAQEIPVWDKDVCIQCGKCVLVCPHAVIRGKVYDPPALAEAPPTFKSTAARWRELQGPALHPAGRAGGLHRLRPLRRGLPGQEQEPRARLKAINMGPQPPLREAERGQLGFLPEAAGGRTAGAAPRQRQGHPAPAAALRVLGGLRRLRRDAVPQAAHASSSATAR